MGFISDWLCKQHPELANLPKMPQTCTEYGRSDVALTLEMYQSIRKYTVPTPATPDELQMLTDAGLDLSMFDV